MNGGRITHDLLRDISIANNLYPGKSKVYLILL